MAILGLWYETAHDLDFLSEIWFAPGDELAPEAARLRDAVYETFDDAWDAANDDCTANQDAGHLESLAASWAIWGGKELPDRFPAWTFTPAFCLRLDLVVEWHQVPEQLAEGEPVAFDVQIYRWPPGANLDLFFPDIEVRAVDPSLMDLSAEKLRSCCGASILAVAQHAVPGSTTEGTLTVHLELLGQPNFISPMTIPIDIIEAEASPCTGSLDPAAGAITVASPVDDQCTEPPPSPISCAGDPLTVGDFDNTPAIAILFDGESCAMEVGGEGPTVVLRLDPDVDEVGGGYDISWDGLVADGWSIEGQDREFVGLGDGDFAFTAVNQGTGARYALTFTVEIDASGGLADITMTVRDATMTLVLG